MHRGEDGEPYQRQADGPAFRLPHTKVAHGLQADGIEGGCKRGHVMRQQEYFDKHAGGEDEHADHKEAYAMVKEHAPHHDERKEQRKLE